MILWALSSFHVSNSNVVGKITESYLRLPWFPMTIWFSNTACIPGQALSFCWRRISSEWGMNSASSSPLLPKVIAQRNRTLTSCSARESAHTSRSSRGYLWTSPHYQHETHSLTSTKSREANRTTPLGTRCAGLLSAQRCSRSSISTSKRTGSSCPTSCKS